MDGQMDGQMDRWTNGWTDGQTHGGTDGRMEFLPILQDFVGAAALLLSETSQYQGSRAREPLTS